VTLRTLLTLRFLLIELFEIAHKVLLLCG